MTEAGLWPAIEALLGDVTRPSRYVDGEWGAHVDDQASYRVCLIYPDTYEVGQANSALAILYDVINRIDGAAAERAYLPWLDMSAAMRQNGVPLFSLESCSAVRDFDLVGITVPYELTYSNILETLDLAGIPLRSTERAEVDPIVVGGGPCVFNPEPVAPFFDAILVGEGEEAVGDIVSAHRAARRDGLSRVDTLRSLAQVPGVYVPSLYEVERTKAGKYVATRPIAGSGAPAVVVKRVVADLDAQRAPTCGVVPYADVVHDRFGLEVLRGCARGCRFCQAGMVYRPVRERSADTIVRDALAGLACTGYDEVSLTSLSTTDYSRLPEVLRRLQQRLANTGTTVSLPSLRADAFGVEMARMVSAGGKKSGLTFAPEAGTQRMRDVVNKNVTEAELLGSVHAAFEAGWRRVKLYFMIGLPTETDEDVRAIGALVGRVHAVARDAVTPRERGSVKVSVSVSTFVPKAQTPFQWEGQLTLAEINRRQAIVRESMPRKGVELHWHDAETSFLEAVMARGGREVADAVEEAWRSGAVFDAWSEQFQLERWRKAFETTGLAADDIACGERVPGSSLTWGHISAGVKENYLGRERDRARAALTTPDCTFGGCTGCDVCGNLDVCVLVAGGSRG